MDVTAWRGPAQIVIGSIGRPLRVITPAADPGVLRYSLFPMNVLASTVP